MVNVFEFNDYRRFMEAYMEALPRRGFGEMGRIATAVGVHPSIITLILKRKKNFSLEQAFDFCEYAGFNGQESDYFMLLVQSERAGKSNLKRKFEIQAEELREKSKAVKSRLPKRAELPAEKRALFYSQWYYSGMRMMTTLPGKQSAEVFAAQLGIPRATAVQVLQFLVENQLVIEKDGRLELGPSKTHISADDPLVQRHHANWRQKAIFHLDSVAPDELHFTGPLSISKKDIPVVRAILLKAIEDVFKVVDPSPSEEAACLTIDWFRF